MRKPGLRLQGLLLLGGLLLLTFLPLQLTLAAYTSLTLRQIDDAFARRAADLIAAQLATAPDDSQKLRRLRESAEEWHVLSAQSAIDEPLGFGPEALRRELRQQAERTSQDSAGAKGSSGRAFHFRLPSSALWVALRADSALGRAASLVRVFSLYAFVVACALLTLAYFAMTRVLIRPLDALARAAENVTLGLKPLEVAASGVRELEELSTSLTRMTEKLLAEEELSRTKVAELQRTTRELSEAQSQIVRAERLATVGRLAAGLAHEIGNPLAALIGLQDLVLEGNLSPEEQKDFLRRMRAETNRIHDTISELLQFARPSGRSAPAEPAWGNVEITARDTVALVLHQASMKGVDVRLEMPPDLPPVAMAGSALTQVLLNLLLNAADALAGSPEPRIWVRAQKRSTRVRITVDDNGPGVSEELRPRIFDPFFTTKDVGNGTGLGLSVCESLVSAAGGTLWLEPAEGGGARFVIELPRPEDGPAPPAPNA